MGHSWPILAAACLGLAVAVSAWFAVSAWEERLAKANFNNVAGNYASVLQNGLNDYLDKILAVRAFYDASVEVDADEFELFTSHILAGYDDAMRLAWAPRITRDERAEFESKARERAQSRLHDQDLVANAGPATLSPQRDEYYPILYSAGASKGASVLSMDVNSEPARSQAIQRARDGDTMATAENIVLRNPSGIDWAGFFVALPVYRQGPPNLKASPSGAAILSVSSVACSKPPP